MAADLCTGPVALAEAPRSAARHEPTDRQLLERFAASQEEAAFETLVRRHGPLVLRVCQRVLQDPHDAEDAFQATFIVLARKAATIGQAERLAGWLHGVAIRIALRARGRAHRRQARERQVDEKLLALEEKPAAAANYCDLRALLDEELDRLPDEYRLPLILCCLQGRSNTEAASQLGWPCGTVKGRLSRARDLLRSRLARRGLVVSAATLGVVLTPPTASAAVPAGLVATTVQAVKAKPVAAVLWSQAAAMAKVAGNALAWAKAKISATTMACACLGAFAIVMLLLPTEPAARQTMQAHAGGIRTVAFSPDGKTYATTGMDGMVKLWDAASNQMQASLLHADGVYEAAFSPDGRTLATGSRDGTGRLWDVPTRQQRGQIDHNLTAFVNEGRKTWGKTVFIAYSPDGKILALSSHRVLKLRDLASNTERAMLAGHSEGIYHVEFSRDGRWVATCSSDKTVRLWDLATGKERLVLPTETDWTWTVTFSPDSKTLAATAMSGGKPAVKLWDVASGKERAVFLGHSSLVYTVAFSPDGKRLASGGADKTVKVWDVATARERSTLKGHPGSVWCAVFSPDGQSLITSDADGIIKLWDVP